MSRAPRSLVIVAVGLVLGPPALSGQEPSHWLPRVRPFQPLIAAPRETQFRGSFVLTDRPDALDYDGRNLEAEVAIGHSLAILRMDSGNTPNRAVTLGYELGIFSRFYMESSQKDLINIDYRVGLPISIRHDAWQARITVRHISSHVGDDFLARFPEAVTRVGDELLQRTRDGVEGLLARTFGWGARLYGGGDLNFHINPRTSRAVARVGAEWDPRAIGGAGADRVWPFAAINFEYPTLSGRPAATMVAGMGAVVNGRLLRLEARGHVGASPMGQLHETRETSFGLGLSMVP